MRRADANIGDHVEYRVPGKSWRSDGTIAEIGAMALRVQPDRGIAIWVAPRHVRHATKKAKPQREQRSLRGSALLDEHARSMDRMVEALGGDEAIAKAVKKIPTRLVKHGAPICRPKDPKPIRSESYLAFVRTKPCVFKSSSCYGPIEAHHHGKHPYGQKTDDLRCIPVCRGHHQGLTDDGHVLGRKAFDGPQLSVDPRLATNDLIAHAQVELLIEWYRTKEKSR